jgi:hypothetical protein
MRPSPNTSLVLAAGLPTSAWEVRAVAVAISIRPLLAVDDALLCSCFGVMMMSEHRPCFYRRGLDRRPSFAGRGLAGWSAGMVGS